MKALAVVVLVAAVSQTQTGSPSIAGVWTAEFEGQTFVQLELKIANGTISGGASLGNIELDQQGAVRRVDRSTGKLTPIFDVVQRDSVVTFSIKESRDIDRFEFRLLEARRAELHFLLSDADREELAASGVPVLRPISLAKQ